MKVKFRSEDGSLSEYKTIGDISDKEKIQKLEQNNADLTSQLEDVYLLMADMIAGA